MYVYAAQREGYSLLAQCVREVWDLSPMPEICRLEGGKPYFPDFPAHHFNLSHSGALALCALGDFPVGVDIQIVRDTWRENLPRRVCSAEQLDWLEDQRDRWAAFAMLWSLKEARVKYTGTGLRVDIRGISVPLPEGERSAYELDGLFFRVWSGPGWAAAVCGEEPPPEDIIWI